MTGSKSTTEHLRRVRLFFVSYAALWLMLAFRALPDHLTLDRTGHPAVTSWLFAALGLWSIVDGWRLVRGAQKRNATTMTFSEVRDEGGAAGGYLATYLLPLLAVTPGRPGEWVAYAIYIGVAAVVFVKTDLALVNPTLYLLGWRVVSAVPALPSSSVELTGAAIVLCRNIAEIRRPVNVVRLGGCYVTKT